MYTSQSHEYDVVIMGAGFAGLCQARHLMLNIPNIKVALIDPRPEERTDKDLKVGESLVEVSSLFVTKELGLYEYMIENHTPKFGLNFHWPKDPARTETIDDYLSIWDNRQPSITTFHMNRSKFERDVLQMNQEMGAVFYNGRVLDVDLTPGDAIKTVKSKVNGEVIELKAKHVIDAAGRRFIIGNKTNNLVFNQAGGGEGSDNLYGVNNGSAWLRVRNMDRSLFHDGYDPTSATASHWYATNHWFGHGHWLWMIPTSTDPLELSIGVIHHHEVIHSEQINTRDKFLAFLKANHTHLYKLITSGEQVDFHYLPRVAHSSKMVFSPDNWYVLGDAAYIFDAFYSYGATMISFAAESITEIIRAKLAGEANAEQKRLAFNEFNLTMARSANGVMRYHAKQLGNASVMSWRIYFEYMWWFGIILPLFIGKRHLDINFVPQFTKAFSANIDGVLADVHQQFNQLVDQGTNLGILDCYRADQLVGEYYTSKRFDDYLENAKYEPGRTNIFASIKSAYYYVAIWYTMFQWKGFGLAGLLAPRSLYNIFRLLALSSYTAIGELIYRFQTRNLPANSQVEKMRQEFKNYQYQAQLQPWTPEIDSPCMEQQSSEQAVPRLPELSVLS
ncbi:MAG: tryptophan halogenase [Trichormus sp. ATA11-4-KO1]|jgi:flavin-dependent dehydrogenase|nr:tryptophan halogenase [Trichormus sp. ATA11-4-KO1]